jgi:hypothetical protein
MKFKAEIEIKNEHLKVLLDYHNGYELNDEYFNLMDRQDIEHEMHYTEGLLDGGFYQCYPLSPTPLGQFILDLYIKQRPKNPSAYEKLMEKMELDGKVTKVDIIHLDVKPEPPQTYGINQDDGIYPSENAVYLK